jgi:hypothetical protein
MGNYKGSGWHRQRVRHSNARKYGKAGGIYSNNFGWHYPKNVFSDKIKGGLADNINPKYFNQEQLQKGVQVELEHTNNPVIAREIATDHLAENLLYYKKLEKIETKPEPIKIKIPKKEVRRDKNQIEKDLQKEIQKTTNPTEKKRLEHMYRELRKADTHTKFKRFINEYGYALSTVGIALPFYIVAPLSTAGVVLGATVTDLVPMQILVQRLAVPITASLIGIEGVKHSIRTIRAIKKREKEIIIEKTKELQENTTLPSREIKKIAKRIAQQELHNTKITHDLV